MVLTTAHEIPAVPRGEARAADSVSLLAVDDATPAHVMSTYQRFIHGQANHGRGVHTISDMPVQPSI